MSQFVCKPDGDDHDAVGTITKKQSTHLHDGVPPILPSFKDTYGVLKKDGDKTTEANSVPNGTTDYQGYGEVYTQLSTHTHQRHDVEGNETESCDKQINSRGSTYGDSDIVIDRHVGNELNGAQSGNNDHLDGLTFESDQLHTVEQKNLQSDCIGFHEGHGLDSFHSELLGEKAKLDAHQVADMRINSVRWPMVQKDQSHVNTLYGSIPQSDEYCKGIEKQYNIGKKPDVSCSTVCTETTGNNLTYGSIPNSDEYCKGVEKRYTVGEKQDVSSTTVGIGARTTENRDGTCGNQVFRNYSKIANLHHNYHNSDPDSPMPEVETSVECSMDTETCEETASILSHTAPFSPVESWTNESTVLSVGGGGDQSDTLSTISNTGSAHPDCSDLPSSLPNFSVFSQWPPYYEDIHKKPMVANSRQLPNYCVTSCDFYPPASSPSAPFGNTPLLNSSLAAGTTPQVAAVAPLNHQPMPSMCSDFQGQALPPNVYTDYNSPYQHQDIYGNYRCAMSPYPSPLSPQDYNYGSPYIDFQPPFYTYEDRPHECRYLPESPLIPSAVPIMDPSLYGTSGRQTPSPDLTSRSPWFTADLYRSVTPSGGVGGGSSVSDSPLVTPVKKVSYTPPWKTSVTDSILTISSSPPESPLLTSSPSPESRGNSDKQGICSSRRCINLTIADSKAERPDEAAHVSVEDNQPPSPALSESSIKASVGKKKPEVMVKPQVSSDCSKTVRELLDEARHVHDDYPTRDIYHRPLLPRTSPVPVATAPCRSNSSPEPLYGEPPLCRSSASMAAQNPAQLYRQPHRNIPRHYVPQRRFPPADRSYSPPLSTLLHYPATMSHFTAPHMPLMIRSALNAPYVTKIVPVGLPFRWNAGMPIMPFLQKAPGVVQPPLPTAAHRIVRVAMGEVPRASKPVTSPLLNNQVSFGSSTACETMRPRPSMEATIKTQCTSPTWSSGNANLSTRFSHYIKPPPGNPVNLERRPSPDNILAPCQSYPAAPQSTNNTVQPAPQTILPLEISSPSPDPTISMPCQQSETGTENVEDCHEPDTAVAALPKWKPKHFDFSTLAIGSFKYESFPGEHTRISRLKLIFSKRCLMYEFQTNNMDEVFSLRKRLMAIIEIPFETIVGLDGFCSCLRIEVNRIPRMYVGSKPFEESQSAPLTISYQRDTFVDLTGGQLLVPYHTLTMRLSSASKIVNLLKTFSSRLDSVSKQPIREGQSALLDPNATDFLMIDRPPPVPQATKCGAEEGAPPPKKKRYTPMRCRCNYGCKTTRCHCVARLELCGESCKCKNCKNPLNLLTMLGMDLRDIMADRCMVFNVFKINNLEDYLGQTIVFPCCQVEAQKKFCVPGLVKCPNKDQCKKYYRFSWCRGVLCDENVLPRQHCVTCQQCIEMKSHTWCWRCQKCYPRERCPICNNPRNMLKDNRFKEPTLNQLSQQDFESYAHHQH